MAKVRGFARIDDEQNSVPVRVTPDAGAAFDIRLHILQHVLWQEPEQCPSVAKMVLMMVSPFDQEAQDILDDAVKAYHEVIKAREDQQTQAGLEANWLASGCPANPRQPTRVP